MLERISKIISALFNPMLIPTYGMAFAIEFSWLHILPLRTRLITVGVVFILTGLLPMIIIGGLSAMEFVKNFALTERKDRTLPYACSLALYISAVVYLYMVNAPWWIAAFLCGGALSIVVVMIVNRWWKISAHATAMGGLLGLVMEMAWRSGLPTFYLWLLIAAILAAGLVGTARLILKCHTPQQVYAGYANGLICILLIYLF